jgi:hypothetical protein
MPRRPATITQADIARAIRAAKQAGAAEVEVRASEILRLLFGLLRPQAYNLPLKPASKSSCD